MTLKEPEAYAVDASAVGVAFAAWTNYLPTVAAALSIVWFLVRIAESDTFNALLRTLTGGWNFKHWRDGTGDKRNGD